MQKLIVASNNAGKIKEIKQILGDQFEIYSMAEVGFLSDIEETGSTFYENALLKAKTVSLTLNLDVLADDSGLMVDALNGAPGIYSARYAGGHGNDKKNRDKLILELKDAKTRRAKFVSSVVLYRRDGTVISGYGETVGQILKTEQGTNGFGYDCIFKSDDLGISFGLATDEQKNKVSHRYRALIDLVDNIKNNKIADKQ